MVRQAVMILPNQRLDGEMEKRVHMLDGSTPRMDSKTASTVIPSGRRRV